MVYQWGWSFPFASQRVRTFSCQCDAEVTAASPSLSLEEDGRHLQSGHLVPARALLVSLPYCSHSFNRYLWSTFSELGSAPGTGRKAVKPPIPAQVELVVSGADGQ